MEAQIIKRTATKEVYYWNERISLITSSF